MGERATKNCDRYGMLNNNKKTPVRNIPQMNSLFQNGRESWLGIKITSPKSLVVCRVKVASVSSLELIVSIKSWSRSSKETIPLSPPPTSCSLDVSLTETLCYYLNPIERDKHLLKMVQNFHFILSCVHTINFQKCRWWVRFIFIFPHKRNLYVSFGQSWSCPWNITIYAIFAPFSLLTSMSLTSAKEASCSSMLSCVPLWPPGLVCAVLCS